MVQQVIRMLKEQSVHRQHFDSIQHATHAISDWISLYNNLCPCQALDMRASAEAFASAI